MTDDRRTGISRVVMLYREENFDAALATFTQTLGITDFETPLDLHEMGLRVSVSWDSGLELIAPLGEGAYAAPMRAHLDAKGEGVFGLVYRVPDLEAAEARATANGHPPRGRIDCFTANPDWRERFSYAMEAPLEPIAGIDVTLIQLDPPTP